MGKGLGVLRAGSGSSGKIVGCAVTHDVGAGEDGGATNGQVLVVREGMFFCGLRLMPG